MTVLGNAWDDYISISLRIALGLVIELELFLSKHIVKEDNCEMFQPCESLSVTKQVTEQVCEEDLPWLKHLANCLSLLRVFQQT